MLTQKIRLKALFLFCIISFISKQVVASNNFAPQSFRDPWGSHVFEQREVQKAVNKFCRTLLLNPKNKTAQENFQAIAAYSDLTAQQKSKVYLLEDLLTYITNLKKRIHYLTSKRDLLKSQLIKKGFDKELFFQDLHEIQANIFRFHEVVRQQEKPFDDQNDPLTFVSELLIDEKEQLLLQAQYLQAQYQWLKKTSKSQRDSLPQPFVYTAAMKTPVTPDNTGQSTIHEYTTNDFEDLNIRKNHSNQSAGDEQAKLRDDYPLEEATANVIHVHPEIYDEKIDQFYQQSSSVRVQPEPKAKKDEGLDIGKSVQIHPWDTDALNENLHAKDNKISELSDQVVDLSLKMSETEMTLNEKIEAIDSLKKELVDVEQRFMLEQKIIQEKNKEIQLLQDAFDEFQLKFSDQAGEEPNAVILENGSLADIATSLKDYQSDLERSNGLINEEVKHISTLESELMKARLKLESSQKTIHEKSERITALQDELALVQLKAQESSDESKTLLRTQDREIKELNAFLNIYKHSLGNAKQIIKAKNDQLYGLNRELAKLRGKTAENESAYQQNDAQIRALKELLLKERKMKDQRNISLRKIIYEKDQTINALKRQLVNTQDNLDVAQQKVLEKIAHIDYLKNELAALHSPMLPHQTSAKEGSLGAQGLAQADALLSSDPQLSELNGILEIYKHKLGEKTRMAKEKEENIAFLEGQLEALQSVLQEKSEALTKTQYDLLSLKVQLTDAQNELLKLKDQSNPTESQGPVIEHKVQELQSKFQDIQHFLLENLHDFDTINTRLVIQ